MDSSIQAGTAKIPAGIKGYDNKNKTNDKPVFLWSSYNKSASLIIWPKMDEIHPQSWPQKGLLNIF